MTKEAPQRSAGLLSKKDGQGLEPATFAVTGRRANQLRHWALLLQIVLYFTACPQRDSNPRYRLERAGS
jgi:hypothetical protein